MYRPPGSTLGGGFGGTSCHADSDCDAGADGRCNSVPRWPLTPAIECTYDRCFTDDDCSPGFACLCWTDYGGDAIRGNQCISAGCRVDADCGEGFQCSLSLAPACGAARYACHTSQDECVETSDCAQPNGANGSVTCAYNGSRWACVSCGPDS